MAYIGNTPSSNPFVVDTYSGTGSQTVFTGLTFAPAGTAAIAVFVNGSYTAPSDYLLTGTTITFNTAPSAGSGNIRILHLGVGATSFVPTDGSVTTQKLGSSLTLSGDTTYTGSLTGGTGVINIGSGQLYKNANGNIGIGTTSPAQRLHVYHGASGGTRTAGVNTIIAESNIEVGLQFLSPNTTTQYIFFGDPQNSQAGRIEYIHSSNADVMAFRTNGAERMRIDSAGNVGIGTSSPQQTLSVGSSLHMYSGGVNSNVTTSPTIRGTSNLILNAATGNTTYINFDRGSDFQVWTNGGSRMRVNSDGNVGIGTDFPAQRLHVDGNSRLSDTEIVAGTIELGVAGTGNRNAILDFHSSGNPGAIDFSARIARGASANGTLEIANTGTGVLLFRQNLTDRFRIDSVGAEVLNGAGIAYPQPASIFGRGSNRLGFGWSSPNIFGFVDNAVEAIVGTVSDYRLKANDQPLTDGLQTVLALRPITYNPVEFDGTVNETKRELGLIAHEVQVIRPSVVTGEKDSVTEEGKPRYQSVNYAGLVPDLIKAIQEQQAIIEQLKADVAELKASQ